MRFSVRNFSVKELDLDPCGPLFLFTPLKIPKAVKTSLHSAGRCVVLLPFANSGNVESAMATAVFPQTKRHLTPHGALIQFSIAQPHCGPLRIPVLERIFVQGLYLSRDTVITSTMAVPYPLFVTTLDKPLCLHLSQLVVFVMMTISSLKGVLCIDRTHVRKQKVAAGKGVEHN